MYAPKGGVDVTSQYTPKGGRDVTDQYQAKSSGWGKNIGGIVGGTIGQIVGTPFDVVSGPAGTMAGGAIGGGLGGAAGETIDQLLSGNGFNGGDIARAGGEQAAFGAIPGGDEVRAIPLLGKLAGNVLGRTVLRAGAGAAGDATAQFIQNGNVDPGEALASGGINAALPGIGKAADLVPSKIANSIQKRIAQSHFGLSAANNPEVAALAHPDPIVSNQNVKNASQHVSGQVSSMLEQKTGNIEDFINKLIESGKSVPPAVRGGFSPDQVGPVYRQWLEHIRDQVGKDMEERTGQPMNFSEIKDVPLSFMNDVKAAIGKNYETDPVAKQMWNTAKKYITDQYGKEGMPKALQELWTKQQALISASANSRKLLNARGVPSLGGSEGPLGEIAGPTATAIALLNHMPVIGSVLGAGTLMQKEMKNPQVANAIKKILEAPGDTSTKLHLPELLQQMGVRLPSEFSPTQ